MALLDVKENDLIAWNTAMLTARLMDASDYHKIALRAVDQGDYSRARNALFAASSALSAAQEYRRRLSS